jgi:hypothetical protein
MGASIYYAFESRTDIGKWESVEVADHFKEMGYGIMAFLADVRNSYGVAPLAPGRGIPEINSHNNKTEEEKLAENRLYYYMGGDDWRYPWDGAHSRTWVSLEELLAFDYDQVFEDRRDYPQQETLPVGMGKMTTYREFLGGFFFQDLEAMKEAKVERILLWFTS